MKARLFDNRFTRRIIGAYALGVCAAGAASAASSPFATRVIAFDPAPGQFVQNSVFNNPSLALGAPIGGGLVSPDNTKVVTLGGFGGSITLGFDHTVYANKHNPLGMDCIVFGNSLFLLGNPQQRHCECGIIEISVDANHNGIADDPWYLIPGSSLPTGVPIARTIKTWNVASLNPTWVPPGRSGTWTTSTFQLTGTPFSSGPIFMDPDPVNEQVWGYADMMPTLLLGDTLGNGVPTDPNMDPALFYTRPDDPKKVGVTVGSGGGSAFSIAWAIDPATGQPAGLDHFDFIRISTGVDYVSGPLGEVSTEVGGVADVGPVYSADWNMNGSVSVQDIFDFLHDWFARTGENGGADFNNSGATTVQDLFDFLAAWFGGH